MTRKELDELEAQWRDQFGEKLPSCRHQPPHLRLHSPGSGARRHQRRGDQGAEAHALRNGKFVMIQGKFPRLSAREGHKQLAEALTMLRTL
jgi:transcription-repair coupling factor (superfamily II helicase)